METWADWRDDVIAVVKAAAKDPTFPGDADPVGKVLDRLVGKLFGACHNGGEVGKDGCPVCRAWRTEKAEKAAAVVQSEKLALGEEVDNLTAKLAEIETASAALHAACAKWEEKCDTLLAELSTAQGKIDALAVTLNTTAAARNDARTKVDYLNTKIDEVSAENTALKNDLRAWLTLAMKIKERE